LFSAYTALRTGNKNLNCINGNLRSLAGYIWRDQVRNTKIGEEFNTLNINNNILKSRSQLRY
jgi:hypothetical protein